MKPRTMAEAFDEWLRAYAENPERFRHTVASVLAAQAQRQAGVPLTYGQECQAILEHLMAGRGMFDDEPAAAPTEAA